MRKKVDKRVIKTKKAIKTSFMSLLEKKEFHTITVAELARHAFIDRKTFYLHYANTDELLKEFENELLHTALVRTEKMAVFSIHEALMVFNDILNENKVFFKNISRTGKNVFFLKRCEEIVVRLLLIQFKNRTDLDKIKLDYQLKYIASGIIAVYMDWLDDENKIPLHDLSKLIGEMLESNLVMIR